MIAEHLGNAQPEVDVLVPFKFSGLVELFGARAT